MPKIRILFLDRDYEHDIYELIRAFYPGSVFFSIYEEASSSGCSANGEASSDENPDDTAGLDFTVSRSADCFRILCRMAEDEKQTQVMLVDEAEIQGESGAGSQLSVRKENKDRIKYALYMMLNEITGKELPWGNLTGIRPAKLAMTMLEAGMKNSQIASQMRQRYLVSPEKTALAVTIANREKAILDQFDYPSGYSLYVGIPFCPSICLYCSFSSYPLAAYRKFTEPYLEALFLEAEAVSEMMKAAGARLDTIYVGGGTPTTLEPDQLRRLFAHLGKTFGFDTVREFTVEAGRPDSISGEKLKAIREFPVTRISVNPQTMNQNTLDLIGRKHTVEQTEEAFYLARETGFDNINMDMIIGLPGEKYAEVENTLSRIRSLGPESLTVHTLAVKRAARLNIFREQYQEMTFEANQEMMELCLKTAREMGMGPYYMYRQKNMKGNFENVGYAREGCSCLYNILIMEEKQSIIALGAGGATKLAFPSSGRIERIENVKDVSSYISRIDEMIDRKRNGIKEWERRELSCRAEESVVFRMSGMTGS